MTPRRPDRAGETPALPGLPLPGGETQREVAPRRMRMVVSGIVQGVGFRPFVHRLAGELGLAGWVLNSTEGVVIEVEGEPDYLDRFAHALRKEAPPRAVVDRVERTDLPPIGYTSFAIESSQEVEGAFALISPDICVCDDCLREMRDPSDRRYLYPFINCTNCGPRFTIVEGVPYDRPKTTMACFPMCPECEAEYHDPTNRRFHAQPVACPVCGPRAWLVESSGTVGQGLVPCRTDGGDDHDQDVAPSHDSIVRSRQLLADGRILAIKGLGGFHLACDATNDQAVAELRRRKRRTDKPFAVMCPDLETVAALCYMSDEERQLLESPQRPIVLLRRREGSAISPLVAPGNRFLGVMLPYTPLHYLLLQRDGSTRNPSVLVMTSGNLSEEPIATGNREAQDRLRTLTDAFLLHNLDIRTRCDDSVSRVFRSREAVVRRSRGYAPFPVRLGFDLRDLLACGAELKSSFCITKGNYAFLSQHIGDLENAETLASYTDSVEHFRSLFRLDVAAIAHDLHPEYMSTRYAWESAEAWGGLPLVPVQHHHAHVASCMVENGVDEPVIGVSFDGTGYGEDGRLWGGEFLVAELGGYRRAAHLKYLPLPGGEAAIKRPYRMAASYLLDALGPEALGWELPPLRAAEPGELALLQRQIERGLNSPLTSSAGRLFDAVAALIGVRQVVNYEGQAAIEMEMVADPSEEGRYEWGILPGDPLTIDAAPAIHQILADQRRGLPLPTISARFHNTVASIIADVCGELRRETGIGVAALSGGVFQNLFLLERACRLLEGQGFRVLVHHQVPANDGGIALGQVAIANRVLSQQPSAYSRQ